MSTGTDVTMTWDGDGDRDPLSAPTTTDLTAAIERLDGARWSLVTVHRADGDLVVGGSAARGLIVYADLGPGRCWTALGTDRAGEDEVELVAGGQPGNYPSRVVLGLDAAVAAAAAFLTTGSLAPEIGWEEN
ncbi:Imm1 family immunity protein [Klenkia terrae]|uniref:Imm1 family immunity protein n=2 Tax=Klenkia terrae TaxID=1052259 RepID=A0ABU8E7S2_9ACTN